jgi:hypothetical protein
MVGEEDDVLVRQEPSQRVGDRRAGGARRQDADGTVYARGRRFSGS